MRRNGKGKLSSGKYGEGPAKPFHKVGLSLRGTVTLNLLLTLFGLFTQISFAVKAENPLASVFSKHGFEFVFLREFAKFLTQVNSSKIVPHKNYRHNALGCENGKNENQTKAGFSTEKD